MPSPQEFSQIVDANTVFFIGFVIRVFLCLVMCLAFLFGFIVAALYGSGALLIGAYRGLSLLMEQANQQRTRKKNSEVVS